MNRLLISVAILLLTGSVAGQERPVELFVLTGWSTQSYEEPSVVGNGAAADKITLEDFVNSYGVGAQVGFCLTPRFTIYTGGGLKYTSTEFGFIRLASSDSDWFFPAMEDLQQFHLFVPLGIYYRSERDKRFKVSPGISLEPHLLLHHSGDLTIWNEDIMSEVAEPLGSPRRVSIVASFNLKFICAIRSSRKVYAELKIHNTQRLCNEKFGMLALPVGVMVSAGFSF